MEWLTQSPEWQALQQHYQGMSQWSIAAGFRDDSSRFDRLSLDAAGLLLDYSKNRILPETLTLLCDLARARGVSSEIERLLSGEPVNCTEGRAAWHTALREQKNPDPLILSARERAASFVGQVLGGECRGSSGKPFRHIVNMGVGGSELGPQLVYKALKPYANPAFRYYFLSNEDERAAWEVFERLDPETTLFIVTSKSFTTRETLVNADRAKAWLLDSGIDASQVAKHFAAVTACADQAVSWGILSGHVFPIWDWVGGRYSIWSSVGLIAMIAVGVSAFNEFLAGAYVMDQHFREADFPKNMPVILALLAVWYGNFFGAQSAAIIPYSEGLSHLPDYLKQLHMESQGKAVQRNGLPVDYATGMILWGGVGTNSQHSFHQLFLQGNQLSPIDFIVPLKSQTSGTYQYDLVANCLGQSRALMEGYDASVVEKTLLEQGFSNAEARRLAVHKAIQGNYPSTTIMMDALTPRHLGALLALYEHKVFVQSVLWNINAFDQWGVEHGKRLAAAIMRDFHSRKEGVEYDSSTRGLIKWALEKA